MLLWGYIINFLKSQTIYWIGSRFFPHINLFDPVVLSFELRRYFYQWTDISVTIVPTSGLSFNFILPYSDSLQLCSSRRRNCSCSEPASAKLLHQPNAKNLLKNKHIVNFNCRHLPWVWGLATLLVLSLIT